MYQIFFPECIFPECIFPECIFPKCIYTKCILAKCTWLALSSKLCEFIKIVFTGGNSDLFLTLSLDLCKYFSYKCGNKSQNCETCMFYCGLQTNKVSWCEFIFISVYEFLNVICWKYSVELFSICIKFVPDVLLCILISYNIFLSSDHILMLSDIHIISSSLNPKK